MKTKTYLLAIKSGDYSEAAYAIVEFGPTEAAAMAEARRIVKTFNETHGGWTSLKWGSSLRCVVLKCVPDAILELFGIEEQDELFKDGGQTWLALPDGFDRSAVAQIPEDNIWRSECGGLQCSAYDVFFTALDKYSPDVVNSNDLEVIFFPPASA